MLKNPATINLQRQAAPAVGITQAVYPVPQDLKAALLVELLERGILQEALVFTRTKHRANRLAEHLVRHGINAARIHGNRSQAQRTEALAGFKSGKYRVLVATDIAARGIDVEALSHVVNFDVPAVPEDYIHRVGRTGRAELTGDAFTFVAPEEEGDLPRDRARDRQDAAARDAARLRLPARSRRRSSRSRSPSASRRSARARPRSARAPRPRGSGAQGSPPHRRTPAPQHRRTLAPPNRLPPAASDLVRTPAAAVPDTNSAAGLIFALCRSPLLVRAMLLGTRRSSCNSSGGIVMLQRCAAVLAAAIMTVACAQTDAGITTNVKTKLAADDTVKAYQIDVDTRNGVVTLSGDVESAAAKEQAIQIARQTDGVRDVIDQLQVGESAATAGTYDLENRAERGAAELKEESREAAVKGQGRRTRGRAEAGEAADKAGAAITDAAITSAVKTKFLADSTVKGLRIDVDTSNGMVTLNGNVSSRAEADRAMTLARNTDGVKTVHNNLKIAR